LFKYSPFQGLTQSHNRICQKQDSSSSTIQFRSNHKISKNQTNINTENNYILSSSNTSNLVNQHHHFSTIEFISSRRQNNNSSNQVPSSSSGIGQGNIYSSSIRSVNNSGHSSSTNTPLSLYNNNNQRIRMDKNPISQKINHFQKLANNSLQTKNSKNSGSSISNNPARISLLNSGATPPSLKVNTNVQNLSSQLPPSIPGYNNNKSSNTNIRKNISGNILNLCYKLVNL